MTLRRLFRIVRGGVRERMRRRRFLAAVGVVAYLGASITTGDIGLTFGGTVAPARNGPWLVSVAGMTATSVVLLGGWVVTGGVLRTDRETGAGETIAATVASDRLVFIAKIVENIVLLGTLAGVVLIGALLTSLVSLDVGISPTGIATFLLLVLPTVVLVAGIIAVLAPIRPFDSIAGGLYLAIGFGLLFVGGLIGVLSVGPSVPRIPNLTIGPTIAWLDPIGFTPVVESAANALGDGSTPSRRPSFGVAGTRITDRFVWNGVRIDSHALLGRTLLFAASLPLYLLGSVIFDRSDLLPGDDGGSGSASVGPETPDVSWLGGSDATESGSVGRLLVSELRIAVTARSRLWQLGLLALPLSGALLPADTARAVVLPVAGIWPLFVWSSVGVRTDRHKTRSVISATRYGHRQPTAELAAAALVGFVAVSGVSLRLALTGKPVAAVTPFAGVMCFTGVATVVGRIGGSGRLFELGVIIIWYVGVLNGFAPLDVLGITDEAVRLGVPAAAAAVGLISAAVTIRTRGVGVS